MLLRTLVRTSVKALPALVVVGALVGCGGGGNSSSSGGTPGAAPSGPPRVPSVDGQIVALTGSAMQVQGSGTQTAVTWTGTTTITAQQAATLADVTVGTCVMAFTSDGVATTVQISPSTDGTCTGPGHRSPGGRPTDMPSDWPSHGPGGHGGWPSGAPTDRPSGMPGGRMSGTAGQVTAVTGTTVTVATTNASSTDSVGTITVGPDTTYTQRVASDSSALVVGQCVRAQGNTDKAGNLTATSIDVSAPTDGGCTPYGRGPGGRGGPAAPGGTNNNG